jgi:hypothetical protein
MSRCTVSLRLAIKRCVFQGKITIPTIWKNYNMIRIYCGNMCIRVNTVGTCPCRTQVWGERAMICSSLENHSILGLQCAISYITFQLYAPVYHGIPVAMKASPEYLGTKPETF